MIDLMALEGAEGLILQGLRGGMGKCIAYPKFLSEFSDNSENFPPICIIIQGNIH